MEEAGILIRATIYKPDWYSKQLGQKVDLVLHSQQLPPMITNTDLQGLRITEIKFEDGQPPTIVLEKIIMASELVLAAQPGAGTGGWGGFGGGGAYTGPVPI